MTRLRTLKVVPYLVSNNCTIANPSGQKSDVGRLQRESQSHSILTLKFLNQAIAAHTASVLRYHNDSFLHYFSVSIGLCQYILSNSLVC